jgi:hypothetical protein
MTGPLPADVQRVFDRCITTEYTTIDPSGQPITWPVTPYYSPADPTIDVTTGLGYPKKANDARANPKVSLLFSDPTGSGPDPMPQVLVQGSAQVDDADLDANRERYAREARAKLPAAQSTLPPKLLQRLARWYFARLYVCVRPERVYVWKDGDPTREPELLDAHMEEVRSGHDEEPAAPHAAPEGAPALWDPRLDELGARHPTAVLTLVAPDGFPFSLRVPIAVDRAARRVRLTAEPVGMPLQPGRACLTAHDHDPDCTWHRTFQVRGDLVHEDGDWVLVPRRLVGGFALPPGSRLSMLRKNARDLVRYHRLARRELKRRGGR